MSTHTMQRSSTTVDQNNKARDYILALLKGEKDLTQPECGPRWNEILNLIEEANTTGNAANLLRSLYGTGHYDDLKALLAGKEILASFQPPALQEPLTDQPSRPESSEYAFLHCRKKFRQMRREPVKPVQHLMP